jgi:hypothetical protein
MAWAGNAHCPIIAWTTRRGKGADEDTPNRALRVKGKLPRQESFKARRFPSPNLDALQ